MRWALLQVAAVVAWVAFWTWLSQRYGLLVGYVLAIAPIAVVAVGYAVVAVVAHRRDRRRLLEQEFRE